MYIDLKWDNINTGTITTNIYRGTAALDRANLGTPLATFNTKTTTYRDNTVTAGITYYYVIEFVANGERTSTRNFSASAVFTRGHGNNMVMFGNDNYGFMDQVTILTSNQVTALLGLPVTGTADTAVGSAMKFSYKGKAVIVMVVPIANMAKVYNDLTPLFNTTGIRVTVDTFIYNVTIPNVLPDTWDGASAPSGVLASPDAVAKLFTSQYYNAAPGALETLGKLNINASAYNLIGREYFNNSVPTRTISSNNVSWYTATAVVNTAVSVPLMFELVE